MSDNIKVYACPDEFKRELAKMTIMELAITTADLRKHPEDANFLKVALLEMKARSKSDPFPGSRRMGGYIDDIGPDE